jgi:hypothetical protein
MTSAIERRVGGVEAERSDVGGGVAVGEHVA